MIQSLSALAVRLRSLKPHCGKTTLIAVDGRGGAGKSSFAARLARTLGDIHVFHTDDFASWENPLEWWPRMLDQVFEPLSRNEPAFYQRYDWVDRRMAEWHEVSPGGVLIVEGVSASRREFRRFLSYSIWIECPPQVRLRRGLERDGLEALELWRQWMADEDTYVDRDGPDKTAELIVNGDPHSAHNPELGFEVIPGL